MKLQPVGIEQSQPASQAGREAGSQHRATEISSYRVVESSSHRVIESSSHESSAAEAVACKFPAVRSAPLAGASSPRFELQDSTNVIELTESILKGPAPTHLAEKYLKPK